MIRRISSFTCALALVVVALVASAAPVEAQSRPFDRGLRIGLATDLVARGEDTTTFGSGFGLSSRTQTTTSYGLGMPRLGIDLGGFPIRWLGVGVALSIGQVERSFASTGSSSTTEIDMLEFGVLPYAEARIPVLDILSIQLRLNVGVVGTEQTERTVGSSSLNSVETTQFAIGGQAGLHVFAAESFSISPYFGFRYTTGDGSVSSTFSSSSTFGVESWQVTLGVALFGWIDLTGGGEPDEVEPIEDVRAMPTQPAPAPAPVAAAPVPSAEPVVAGDVMATDLAIPGATARILGNVTTGDARLELRTTAAQPRFATCTEALLSSDGRSALVPVRVQATQTLTGFDETLLITGRPEQLDALRGENARIELCGIRVDVDANNRYRIGRLLAALRMASPAAHGSPPATQPPAPAPAAPATGLTSPSP